MKGIGLIRWGVPAVGFAAYVKWGGVSLALVFAGILFAVMSGLIHWRRTSPSSFFGYIRAIVVLFVLLPAIVATLVGAFSGLLGLMLALPVLALAIFLTRWAFRAAAKAPAWGTPSMAAQNLQAANALTSTIQDNNRRSHARGTLMHTQAENLALDRRNRQLEAEKAALERRVHNLEREASLPPDPFADPIPPSRS